MGSEGPSHRGRDALEERFREDDPDHIPAVPVQNAMAAWRLVSPGLNAARGEPLPKNPEPRAMGGVIPHTGPAGMRRTGSLKRLIDTGGLRSTPGAGPMNESGAHPC